MLPSIVGQRERERERDTHTQTTTERSRASEQDFFGKGYDVVNLVAKGAHQEATL